MKVLVLSAPVEPPLYVERGGRLITLGRGPEADVKQILRIGCDGCAAASSRPRLACTAGSAASGSVWR